MGDALTLDPSVPPSQGRARDDVVCLAVAWSATGDHLGEILRVTAPGPKSGWVFGRDKSPEEEQGRLWLTRRRPDGADRRPFESPYVSRVQLLMRAMPEGIEVQNIGKRRLLDDARRPADRVVVAPGQTIEIEDQLLFVCVSQPAEFSSSSLELPRHTFGEADAHGIVGEGPAAWRLREGMGFMGARDGHVLLFGESGTGKELVAQGIHALSSRARRPIVSRNAAVFPSGLIDAELFGNIANYPNSGTPERPGLIGQAQGSTLFLDEIGELPLELQAHLLRVLDADGEYQRLGEARPRKADIRLIGATARTPESLRPDFAARFRLRLELPGLAERREDIALITRHLLQQACKSDPRLSDRLFRRTDDGSLAPRVTSSLMRFLVTHRYTTHVRELDAFLWRAIASGSGRLDLNEAVRGFGERRSPSEAPPQTQDPPREPPTKQEVLVSLERHGGVKERAWRDLGLSSRYALKRLIRKYGIEGADDPSEPESDRRT
jgi:two-component system nitrogen regulation response regulator GlnG/two-component system response regulator HydG